MKQGGMDVLSAPIPNQHKQVDEIYSTSQQLSQIAYLRYKSQAYQHNLEQYLQLNPDSFSIAQAIYLTETAWDDDLPTWQQFEDSIKKYANLVKQLLQREGLNAKNNTAINYGVQKLYQQDNAYYDPADKKLHTVPKLEYDFNDPMGDGDWSNMFVTKLLKSGKGQCHNLPLNYLCIVQKMGGKAYLVLAPNHSYIQYFDEKGARYSFETTNGYFIRHNWMMQSTGVSAVALKHGTYLDTLSSRRLYAHCLGDMLLGYVQKIGYDRLADQMVRTILQIDESNLTALTVLQWYTQEKLKEAIHKEGNPPASQMTHYPVIHALYKELMNLHAKMDNIGILTMPLEVYRQWLRSMNNDSQKEQDRQIYEKLLRELQKQKKIKPTFKNSPKEQ